MGVVMCSTVRVLERMRHAFVGRSYPKWDVGEYDKYNCHQLELERQT